MLCVRCVSVRTRGLVSHACRPVRRRGELRSKFLEIYQCGRIHASRYFQHPLQCSSLRCKFAALDSGRLNDHLQNTHQNILEHESEKHGSVWLDERCGKQQRRQQGKKMILGRKMILRRMMMMSMMLMIMKGILMKLRMNEKWSDVHIVESSQGIMTKLAYISDWIAHLFQCTKTLAAGLCQIAT